MSSPLSRCARLWIPLLASAAGCIGARVDDTLLVGKDYVCLFDSGLECQTLGNPDVAPEGIAEPPARRFERVDGGDLNLCGITEDGEPVCWGWDKDGQSTVPAGLDVASFAVGYTVICALDPGGRLTCWGNEWEGSLDGPEGPFDKVALAEGLICGWSGEDGWTCWGRLWGVEGTELSPFDWDVPDEEPVSLVSGPVNICMLDASGQIFCWGDATYGVTRPPDGTGWHDLSVGLDHACATDSYDDIMCWGSGITSWWRLFPQGDWATYVAGFDADCGIRTDGEVDCWGCLDVDPFACDWED